MYPKASKLAVALLVGLGSLTAATAEEIKASNQSLAKELILNLGNGVKLVMVLMPVGEFQMGSPKSDDDAGPDEQPQHRVRITKPFYLGKYLVTQEQWNAVTGNKSNSLTGLRNPVVNVSWEDCQKFFGRLNKQQNATSSFQLPTEAQWEYACRAGGSTKYSFGDDEAKLDEYAWYDVNSAGERNHVVGEKKPNGWGLYDMHGNVFEWCADWHGNFFYAASPPDDPTGPATGSYRVIRGGNSACHALSCRSASRAGEKPARRSQFVGFRIVESLPTK